MLHYIFRMLISKLMLAVIKAAVKGSGIAAIIRSNDALLRLLVEEKTGVQKNNRFVADFKTLADVLIQEMIRHDLCEKFSGLEDSVYGEESNKFTNVLGETITINLSSTPQNTKILLLKVLDGNDEAAELLSHSLHDTVSVTLDERIQNLTNSVDQNDIGIWIDPIDSTAQYIQGDTGEDNSDGFVDEGLQCVTVLVGVFIKSTGLPILGVVVQPFSSYNSQSQQWSEKIIWGLCFQGVKLSSIPVARPSDNQLILLSSSESKLVQDKLAGKFDIKFSSGAGYKLLCVAQGKVTAYLLSKKTIYRWDCCGLHAILLSLGGGMVSYSEITSSTDSDINVQQITYNYSQTSNAIDGIIAYNYPESLLDIVECLLK